MQPPPASGQCTPDGQSHHEQGLQLHTVNRFGETPEANREIARTSSTSMPPKTLAATTEICRDARVASLLPEVRVALSGNGPRFTKMALAMAGVNTDFFQAHKRFAIAVSWFSGNVTRGLQS